MEHNNIISEEFFSWYPGHIAKAEQELRQKWLPLLDLIIELVDARVPQTGRYHDRKLFGNKNIITVYTKGDLCNLSTLWQDQPEAKFIINARNNRWRSELIKVINKKTEIIKAKLQKQGRNRKIRLGVCGLPNVGKSTFLNSLLGRAKKAKTGNLPGVTRQMQFITHKEANFDLLDTPGICPVKIPRSQTYKLVLCNLLPEKLFDPVDIARQLLLYHPISAVDGHSIDPDYLTTVQAKLLIKHFRTGDYNLVLDQEFNK